MFTRFFQLSIAFIVFILSSTARANDVEYWSWYTFNLRKWFSTYAEFRMKDNFTSEPSLMLISPKVRLPLHRNLGLVAGYTYISSKRSVAVSDIHDRHRSQHRFEFEVDPQVRIFNKLKLKNRNRLELRRIEDADGWRNRMRNRIQVVVPFRLGNILEGIYFNNEAFIDFHENSYNENRLIPIGVILKLNHSMTLRFYYMQRSTKTSGSWSANHIAGTFLTMNF